MQSEKEIIRWKKSSDKLVNEMKEYAENYKCKKCNNDWCEHMIKDRYKQFKKRINADILTMVTILRS